MEPDNDFTVDETRVFTLRYYARGGVFEAVVDDSHLHSIGVSRDRFRELTLSSPLPMWHDRCFRIAWIAAGRDPIIINMRPLDIREIIAENRRLRARAHMHIEPPAHIYVAKYLEGERYIVHDPTHAALVIATPDVATAQYSIRYVIPGTDQVVNLAGTAFEIIIARLDCTAQHYRSRDTLSSRHRRLIQYLSQDAFAHGYVHELGYVIDMFARAGCATERVAMLIDNIVSITRAIPHKTLARNVVNASDVISAGLSVKTI